MSAVFSACGTWRYLLRRDVGVGEGTANFVMLNPSTADATRDDPTIRRCSGFARRWGYRQLLVTNLFGYRTPDPQVLRRTGDPVGPENDAHVRDAASTADLVVVAWGHHGALLGRDAAVLALLAPLGDERDGWRGQGGQLAHLGLTVAGRPRHPLFVRGETVPLPFCRR